MREFEDFVYHVGRLNNFYVVQTTDPPLKAGQRT